MMKKRQGIMLLIAVATFCLSMTSSCLVKAAGGYDTDRYTVTVDVTSQQNYQVSERIDVNFWQSRHGIYRYIPFRGVMQYYNQEGKLKKEQYKAKISDVRVNEKFTTSSTGSPLEIKIGDGNILVDGDRTYDIHYNYQMYNDEENGLDLFYMNVIPQKWESIITEADVTINMPKEFDESKLEVYSGGFGERNTTLVDYYVEGNTIHISGQRLTALDGITVYLPLEEEYFTDVPNDDAIVLVVKILVLISILLMIVLWIAFGKDRKYVKTVEFYPPEDMDPARIGYICDLSVDKQDMMAMILHFAQKGYLTIEEEGKGYKKKFTLIKIDEGIPNDAPQYQQTFYKALFGNKASICLKDLKPSFYSSYQKSLQELKDSFYDKSTKKNEIIEKSKGQMAMKLVALFSFVIVALCCSLIYDGLHEIFMYGFPGTLLCVSCCMISNIAKRSRVKSVFWNIARRILAIVVTLIAALLALGTTGAYVDSLGLSLLCFIQSIVISLTIGYMGRRTPRGAELQGRILGFRDFLMKAEKNRIETLVMENPSYFYDILPYAYVLGVTDKWVNQFENIPLDQPGWYRNDGNEMFRLHAFASSMDHCSSSFSHGVSASAPSSSGGGGGGFSGGGVGGGGGGSW